MARFNWEKASLIDQMRKNRDVYYEFDTNFLNPEAFVRAVEEPSGNLTTLVQVNDYENSRKIYYVIKKFQNRQQADYCFDKLAKEDN